MIKLKPLRFISLATQPLYLEDEVNCQQATWLNEVALHNVNKLNMVNAVLVVEIKDSSDCRNLSKSVTFMN